MGELNCNNNILTVWLGLKDGFLSGPLNIEFSYSKDIKVSIEQFGRRTIKIVSETAVSCDELFEIFQKLEKLLVLFDGQFLQIKKVYFQVNKAETIDCTHEYNEKQLKCYSSKDFCKYSFLKLISFQDVLGSEQFKKWEILLEELDIAYIMYLYSLSDNQMPVDVNFAFLVELAEPFVELVRDRTDFFQSLKPGCGNTSLKDCLRELINYFGEIIFDKEKTNDYEEFLKCCVSSRVRIMHIKKKQLKHFNGKECVRYSMKFSLLYRKIIFELLGIDYSLYDNMMNKAVKRIDEW